MRNEIWYIFRLCQVIGASPFSIQSGRIRFKWASKQLVYFLLVFSVCLCYLGFQIRAVWIALSSGETVKAFGYSAWLASAAATTLAQFTLLWRHSAVEDLIDTCAQLWESNQHDKRFHIDKIIWPLHLLWILQSFLFPGVSIALMNMQHPASSDVLLSSIICQDDEDCSGFAVAMSIFVQTVFVGYIYAAVLIIDVLPMSTAIHSTRALKLSELHLEDHVSRDNCTFACSVKYVKPEDASRASSAAEEARFTIAAIRSVMRDHLKIQRQLHKCVPAFSPLVLLCTGQIFVMCLLLFFAIIKQGLNDWVQTAVFLGNGMQYLVRGTIVFSAFGNVREAALDMRRRLLLESGVIEDLGKRDATFASEVSLFLSSLDDVAFQAGPYFTCTHSFVFTFYGILATYLAVLIQSL